MNADDFMGAPDRELVAALDTPFAWPKSGLEPLPWFPFTVAASATAVDAAGRIARRAEHAYWYLRKLLRFTPRFRLLVLSRADWPKFAEVDAYGVAHLTTGGHLVVGSDPADRWREISRELARTLSPQALRTLCHVHGSHPVHRDAPDLGELAEALVARELSRLIARQARASFVLPWLADAFASYALVAVLGETDPAMLHRLGTLAEATRELPTTTRGASKPTVDRDHGPLQTLLADLALTRAAYVAYAHERGTGLARWFHLSRKNGPASRAAVARLLSREVHPAIGALAGAWHDDIPHAA